MFHWSSTLITGNTLKTNALQEWALAEWLSELWNPTLQSYDSNNKPCFLQPIKWLLSGAFTGAVYKHWHLPCISFLPLFSATSSAKCTVLHANCEMIGSADWHVGHAQSLHWKALEPLGWAVKAWLLSSWLPRESTDVRRKRRESAPCRAHAVLPHTLLQPPETTFPCEGPRRIPRYKIII